MKTSNRCKSPTLNWFLIGSLLLFVLIASKTSTNRNKYTHAIIEGNTENEKKMCLHEKNPVNDGYEYYLNNEGNYEIKLDRNGGMWRYRKILVKDNDPSKPGTTMSFNDAKNSETVRSICSNHQIRVLERHYPEKLYEAPESADYDYMQKLAAVRFGVPVIDIPDGFLPNPHVKYSEGDIGSELSSIVKDEVHDNIWCKAPSTYTKVQKKTYCSRDTPHPANLFMKV